MINELDNFEDKCLNFLDSFERGLIKNKSYKSKFSLDKNFNRIKKCQICYFYNEYDTENFGIPHYSSLDVKDSETSDENYVISFYKKTLYSN